MSFILEALKKSEQQRQQKSPSLREVRKRTLSLPSRRQGRGSYWLVAGALFLVLLSGLWLYNKTGTTVEQVSAVTRSTSSSASLRQSGVSAPVITTPEETIVSQQSAAAVDPTPVPRDSVSAPTVPAITRADKNHAPNVESRQTEGFTAQRGLTSDKHVETVVSDQLKPRPVEKPSLDPTAAKLPHYLGLSRGLRGQMPPLVMSLHYYITDPARRMVRINNQLLHEGDWVSNDLQVFEITRTGVTLDFQGKLFEMRSVRR